MSHTQAEEEEKLDARLSRIRNTVNENKIKLWIEPYYTSEAGPVDEELLQLASTLSISLQLDVMTVLQGVKQLQKTALDKLEARHILSTSGQLIFRVKLAQSRQQREQRPQAVVRQVQVDSGASGRQLMEAVATQFGLDSERVKLIANGKTIEANRLLTDQDLKPGTMMLALNINPNDRSLAIVQEQRQILDDASRDVTLLAENDELCITDQNGQSIAMKESEKKPLILAMSLHEKGRMAMKKKNFELALVLLLESMQNYQHCHADILQAVDNYGLLNLDIAWCYLMMANVSELPNAENRLKECEGAFVRSYGANLERLMAIKGSSGTESVLLMRLHLLQAVLAYHSGFPDRAESLLRQVEQEIAKLDVPEELIQEVEAQGYSRHESRIALRATANHVIQAVHHARQAREMREKVTAEEEERRKKRQCLGKTATGSWINLGYVASLTQMGFEEALVVEALRHTDNQMDDAVTELQNNVEMLMDKVEQQQLHQSLVSTLTDMGFSEAKALEALRDANGVLADAIDFLTAHQSSAKRKRKEIREARQRMTQDLDEQPDDYLDISMDEEKEVVRRYRGFLADC